MRVISFFVLLLLIQFTGNSYAQDASPTTAYEISNFASASDTSFIDWESLQGYPIDPIDVSATQDTLDWERAWVANDASHFYIAYRNYGRISTTWGQTIYIDSDDNAATGWQSGLPIGADYVIQGSYIFSYDGDAEGTIWQWNLVHNTLTSHYSEQMEYKFTRSLIGNPDTFKLVFVGSNQPYGGTVEDLYPDSVYSTNLENRYFTYQVASGGNSAPTVDSYLLSTMMDQPATLTLFGNDVDGDELSYNVTLDPENGVLQGTAPNFTYVPNPGFEGVDTLFYIAYDGQYDSEEGVVEIDVRAAGVNPVVYSNPVDSIILDGDLSDWDNLQSFAEDRINDVNIGGDNPVDFTDAGLAHNHSSLFLYYENAEVPLAAIEDWTTNVFLDTDLDNTTGFQDGMAVGPDYLLQGAHLYSYAGDGGSWDWAYEGDVTRSVMGTQAEFMLDRVAIGDPQSVRVALIGDNLSIGGRMTDFYPDGIYNALRGYRYFEYHIGDTAATPQNTLSISAALDNPVISIISASVSAQQPFLESLSTEQSSSDGGGAVGLPYLLFIFSVAVVRRHRKLLLLTRLLR